MSIRSRISDAWSALTGRAAPVSGAGSYSFTGGPMTVDAFGAKRAPSPWRLVETYKGLVYACANGNAKATVRTPLRMYAKTSKGQARPRCAHVGITRSARHRLEQMGHVARSMSSGDEVHEVLEHPVLSALDNPNSEFDRIGLLKYISLSLDIVGSGYIAPVDGGFGPPVELWPLEPHWVFPVRSSTSAIVQKYTYFSKDYLPDQLIRFRDLGLRDAYGPGYSNGQAAFEYGGLEDKWLSVQDQLLGIQARPGVMISSFDQTQAMGEPEAEKLESKMNKKFGPGGQGRIFVNRTGLRVDPIAYPPIDPGGLELSKYDVERVANCFGYPVEYLTGDTNLANLQAAHRKHGEQAIEPRHQLIASVLTSFVQRYDSRLFFAFDECLPENEESKGKVWEGRIKNGWKLNDWLNDEGYEEVSWGHEAWIPSTLRQPSEPRQQPMAPATQDADKEPPPDPKDPDDDESKRAFDLANRALSLLEREDDPGRFPEAGREQPRRTWLADRRADRG
jgi:hypothetical protein